MKYILSGLCLVLVILTVKYDFYYSYELACSAFHVFTLLAVKNTILATMSLQKIAELMITENRSEKDSRAVC